MALKNEFLNGRVAKVDFSVLASAATQNLTSGVFIPSGALITGITFMNSGVPTIANASGSIDLRLAGGGSSVALVSTAMIKNVASAQTIPTPMTLVSSAGMYVPQDAELVLSVQATSGTAVHTWAPTVYVGYIA